MQQDADNNINVEASLNQLSEGVSNITVQPNSTEPIIASTPIVPGVSVGMLPEVTLAPIVEDNPVQPTVEPPVVDRCQSQKSYESDDHKSHKSYDLKAQVINVIYENKNKTRSRSVTGSLPTKAGRTFMTSAMKIR